MTDLPESTARPCNECPWRRESWAGHLGPFTAEQWVDLAHSDTAIACHKTIKEEGEWDGAMQCAGAAIYRANVVKRPRDPAVAVGEQDKEAVFARPYEFVEHHEGFTG